MVRALLCVTLVSLSSVGLTASASAAEPTCTVAWDGDAGTESWHDALNWSEDTLPGAADAVCIADQTPDITVTLGADVTTSVQSIQSSEPIDVAAGLLLISDYSTETASLVPRLILSGGVLAGDGFMTVSQRLDWSAGWIGRDEDDFVSVYLNAGTTLKIHGAGPQVLGGYLRNEGAGHVTAGSTLTVKDSGTMFGVAGRLLVDGSLSLERGAGILQAAVEIPPGVALDIDRYVRVGTIENHGSVVVRGTDGQVSGIRNFASVELLDGARAGGVTNELGGEVRVGWTSVPGPPQVAVGWLENHGLLRVDNGRFFVSAPYGTVSTGTFDLDAGAVLELGQFTLDGASLTGTGTFRTSNGSGQLDLRGTTTIGTGTTVDHLGGDLYLNGTLGGGGTFRWLGGYLRGPAVVTIGPELRFELVDPTMVDEHVLDFFRVDGDATITNKGVFVLVGWPSTDFTFGSDLVVRNEGMVLKDGSGNGGLGGTVDNYGTVELAAGRTLYLNGYSQAAEGVLLVHVDGPEDVSGQIWTGSAVELAGTLRVADASEYPLRTRVMSYGSRTGAFASVESDLGEGRYYDARYGESELVLVVHDVTPPTNPSLYTQEPGVWSPYQNVYVSHDGAADDLSGVDGFSFVWDTNEFGVPDFVKDVEEDENPIVAAVPDGNSNYFHLRTVDQAGNWSEDVVTLGPFFIDTTSPTAPQFKPGEIDLPYQRDRTIKLAWTRPTDAGSGLDTNVTYWIYVRETKRDEPWVDQTSTIGSYDEFVSYEGRPGFNYCFRIEAKDRVGNQVLSAERCTAVPLDDRQLEEKGAWADLRGSGYYLGTVSRASRRGAALMISNIRASRLALIATRCPECGRVRVYFGGQLLKEVSLDATTTRKKQFISVARFETPREGTLRIVIRSRGKTVKVEGFAIVRPADA